MNTNQLSTTLTTLFAELVEGAPPSGAYMLNVNDPGLLRSLDRLSAAAASSAAPGRSSIAAHADHLRYGLSHLAYHLGAIRQIDPTLRGPSAMEHA